MVSILEQIERAKQARGKGFFSQAQAKVLAEEKKSILDVIAKRQKSKEVIGSVQLPKVKKQETAKSVQQEQKGLFERSFVAQAFVPTVQAPQKNPVLEGERSVINVAQTGSRIRNVEQQDVLEDPSLFLSFVRVQGVKFRDFLGGIFG